MSDQFSLPNTQYMISTMATMGFYSKPLLDVCSQKIIGKKIFHRRKLLNASVTMVTKLETTFSWFAELLEENNLNIETIIFGRLC